MKKSCLVAVIFALSLILPLNRVFSATLTLDNISALSTGGNVYNEWWYTGTSPTLSGTVEEGASVQVTVDGEEYAATVDGTSWAFWSDKFASGDFAIEITSGDESLSFTLHLGQTMSGTASETTVSEGTSSVPATGSNQLIALTSGATLFALAWYFWDRKQNLKAFERSF